MLLCKKCAKGIRRGGRGEGKTTVSIDAQAKITTVRKQDRHKGAALP